MATVHLYGTTGNLETGFERKEVSARTLQLPRSMNIENIASWWKQCRKAFYPRILLPLEYEGVEILSDRIVFDLGNCKSVVVDRKRAML